MCMSYSELFSDDLYSSKWCRPCMRVTVSLSLAYPDRQYSIAKENSHNQQLLVNDNQGATSYWG